MKNLITLVVLCLIAYSVLENNKAEMFGEFGRKEEVAAKNPTENIEKGTKEEKIQAELKLEKNYPYPPSGFIERVVTNAVSDFIQTEPGKEVAKSILTPTTDLLSSGTSIKVANYKGFKKKYNTQYLTNSENAASICGQRVKVHVAEFNSAAQELYNKVLELKIGESEIDEFNVLLDGLKKGETIKANFLSKSSMDAPMQNVLILSVIDHISKYEFEPGDIRIFDEYISTERPVTCGDKVNLLYKITSLNNKKIKADEISFVVGDDSYPIAFSYVVNGTPFIGSRTSILPAKYLESGENSILKNYPNELVILEIKNVSKIPEKEILDDAQSN